MGDVVQRLADLEGDVCLVLGTVVFYYFEPLV